MTPGARIRRERKARKITLEGLSELTGMSEPVLSRIERGTRRVTADDMQRVAGAMGLRPADLLDTPLSRQVTVRGSVEAGLYQPREDWPEDEWYQVAIPPMPRYHGLDLQGAQVRGTSMNRIYPPGTVVVWAPMWQLQERGEGLRDGGRYIVRAHRKDGAVETTLKTFRRGTVGAPWLMPESDDPAYAAPIRYNEAETDSIEIVGRVVASFRPEEE